MSLSIVEVGGTITGAAQMGRVNPSFDIG
jgi:hypothetical protein